MDAHQFGTFVAQQRKERGMTQVLLADRIHVTDKAVSRWERGVGLPDIGNIEPLADALDVSVAELMRAERTEGHVMPTHEADEACKGALDLTKAQAERETRDVVVLIALLSVATMLMEMLSSLRWSAAEPMMTMNLPLTYPLIPGVLVAYAIWRGVHGKTWKLTASIGIVLIVMPALLLMWAFLISAYTS